MPSRTAIFRFSVLLILARAIVVPALSADSELERTSSSSRRSVPAAGAHSSVPPSYGVISEGALDADHPIGAPASGVYTYR